MLTDGQQNSKAKLIIMGKRAKWRAFTVLFWFLIFPIVFVTLGTLIKPEAVAFAVVGWIILVFFNFLGSGLDKDTEYFVSEYLFFIEIFIKEAKELKFISENRYLLGDFLKTIFVAGSVVVIPNLITTPLLYLYVSRTVKKIKKMEDVLNE